MLSYKDSPHFGHKIYLIRHGETAWSKSKQHTGLTDIPLTKRGEEQARALKPLLSEMKFSKVFCSPLIRVQKTCELAGLRDQAELADELYEWNYGDYEGKTTEEIRKQLPNWNIFDYPVINGESIEEVASRARCILQKCQSIQGDVALFASGHITRILAACWINQEPKLAKHLALSTATLSILSYEHEWPTIKLWNSSPKLSLS